MQAGICEQIQRQQFVLTGQRAPVAAVRFTQSADIPARHASGGLIAIPPKKLASRESQEDEALCSCYDSAITNGQSSLDLQLASGRASWHSKMHQ